MIVVIDRNMIVYGAETWIKDYLSFRKNLLDTTRAKALVSIFKITIVSSMYICKLLIKYLMKIRK